MHTHHVFNYAIGNGEGLLVGWAVCMRAAQGASVEVRMFLIQEFAPGVDKFGRIELVEIGDCFWNVGDWVWCWFVGEVRIQDTKGRSFVEEVGTALCGS